MSLTLEQAAGQKIMVSFVGQAPSPEILALLRRQHIGGVTLFRDRNVANPGQVRALTAALQTAAAAAGQPPLLIAVDQEGGTLQALVATTPFPGNLALGAAGSPDLARRVGYAMGRELAALGINVNYAPVCDVNVNPRNAVVGPRSFGEVPEQVAALSAALVTGLQAAGVAATAKHFPGHGDTNVDSHAALPILRHDAERLRRVELPPFEAAIRAGVKLVMTAHVALPALTGDDGLPATLSSVILRDLLRAQLGFAGVTITDALDMNAIQQGPGLMIDAVVAAAAGVDMLLLHGPATEPELVFTALRQAALRGLLSPAEVMASAERVLALKAWCARQPPAPLEVVGCAEHRVLAAEVAARSVTLVQDHAGRLPLQLPAGARIAVIVPKPQDLTPADTSSYESLDLAGPLRAFGPAVDQFVVSLNPTADEVAGLRARADQYALIIVGTINATLYAGQADLVNAILETGAAVIAVALRMPDDLLAYPAVPTYLCTYSLQPPSLEALAQALWGRQPCLGHLPISIPGR